MFHISTVDAVGTTKLNLERPKLRLGLSRTCRKRERDYVDTLSTQSCL